jgi:hypothetical protein
LSLSVRSLRPACSFSISAGCESDPRAWPILGLLGREEVDEKSLSGLRGVVKISHSTVDGTSLLNFDGFAFPPPILFRASLTVILGLSEIRVSVLCSELRG